MKIVCVGYLHGAGGAERQIVMLANNLAKMGHNVTLIILACANIKYEISSDVKILDLTVAEQAKGNKIFNRFKALKKAYLDISPDVTIHYWLQSAYLTAFMNGNVRGKIIYSERGDPGDKEYKGLLAFVRLVAFKKMDGFVFQSIGARDYFKKDVKNKSIIIPNSVHIPLVKYDVPCKNRVKRIVNVGRLDEQKNQKLLIEAFALIANEIPDYTLEIFGEGTLKDSLEKLVCDRNLQGRVIFRETTKNIFEEVYKSSLFVLSSDFEGMPNALMEAMALGVPCISTDCRPGGARELITDGYNGYIVDCGSVCNLAKTIKKVLGDDNLSVVFANNAMEIRKTHSDQEVFLKWAQYIEKVVKTDD